MRKIISLFIVIMLLFTMVGCDSYPSSTNDSINYRYYEIKGGYKICASSNYSGELIIPESYNGLPILEIEFFDSHYSRNVTRIVGSKNLEVINSYSFAGRDQKSMDNLTEVVFPFDANLKVIDTMAFYWQTGLKTVVLPQNFEYFGDGVFERCFNLENLVIYNVNPPIIDDDLFVFIESSNDYWNTKPHENFTVFVPNDAVDTYMQSVWNQYTIKPISEADFLK